MLSSGRTSYATSATSDIKHEQGLNYFIKYVLCLEKLKAENIRTNKKWQAETGTKCSYKKTNVYTHIYACRTDE